MCRATNIDYLRRFCDEFHAAAPNSFWNATEDELRRAYNGIGPERWPSWMRNLITAMLRPFQAAAFIHDWEYSLPEKTFGAFTMANLRLAQNVAREAIYDCRPFMIFAGLPIAALCEFFGWHAFKTGKLRND